MMPETETFPVQVRLARPEDADGVAALVAESGAGTVAEHRDGFLGELKAALVDNLILVAEAAGGIVGFGRARRFAHPPEPPPGLAPAGWYLLGVRVADEWRRRGVGTALTRERLAWIARRAHEAFYFTGADNHASAALHAHFGFVEVSREFTYPRAEGLEGGGVLYRVELRGDAP